MAAARPEKLPFISFGPDHQTQMLNYKSVRVVFVAKKGVRLPFHYKFHSSQDGSNSFGRENHEALPATGLTHFRICG